MFMIDKQRYGKQDIRFIFSKWLDMAGWSCVEGKRVALCTKNTSAAMAIILSIKEHHGSILLLNGDTPKIAALELAKNAGCHMLVYGNLLDCVEFHNRTLADTPSIYQYSSGTTGDRKLVCRSWTEVDEEIQSYNRALSPMGKLTPLIVVPVSHSYGLITGALASISREVTPIIIQDKNPKFALHMIRSCPDSVVYAVPFLLHILLSFPSESARFHHVVTSGAPMSDALWSHLKRQSDVLWQQYGCSETGCISIGSMPEGIQDVGRPLDRLQVAAGSSPDSPEEVTIRSGEHDIQTRDLGYLSPKGALHILGRMDDVINVGGMMVIPSEVERTVARMPGVAEAVVHRTGHKIWGEAVKALVVPEDSMSEADVREWCIQHLPPYQVPHQICFVEEIPKTDSGKVSRKQLQEQERA
jgi:3,4-dihydroxybenzoate---[aryl-carrier protein] ligase